MVEKAWHRFRSLLWTRKNRGLARRSFNDHAEIATKSKSFSHSSFGEKTYQNFIYNWHQRTKSSSKRGIPDVRKQMSYKSSERSTTCQQRFTLTSTDRTPISGWSRSRVYCSDRRLFPRQQFEERFLFIATLSPPPGFAYCSIGRWNQI